MVMQLLDDLNRYCGHHDLHVHLTLNVAEEFSVSPRNYNFQISIHRNSYPLGFAANQNAAFRRNRGYFYCVVNPDVRLSADPFSRLIGDLHEGTGVIAPKVVGTSGKHQCSARRLPTPWQLLRRWLGLHGTDYRMTNGLIYPDWVAGMFMLFPSAVYESIGGFDEKYFLYYEDVDLCARLRLHGWAVCLDPEVTIIHDGSYASHRNARYLFLHLKSMFRFLTSGVYGQARKIINEKKPTYQKNKIK